MFQSIYESPWLFPGVSWAAGLVLVVVWARGKPFLTAFLGLFLVEICADAFATGALAPKAFATPPASTVIGIVFVVLGDLRYFLLLERIARDPRAERGHPTRFAAFVAALAWSLVVPVASAVANRATSGRLSDPRWTFLVYEAMFAALAVALRAFWLPRRLAAAPAEVRRWLLRVTHFEIAQYVLWALADVWILRAGDAGFALRIIPNAMYYAAFLPFVAATAPADLDPT